MGYYTFTIPKKSGGTRLITAPDEALKKKQKEFLKETLYDDWISRRAHGFAKRRNIISNAQVHAGKKYILNIDIKDFFPSIRWNRLRKHYYNPGDRPGRTLRYFDTQDSHGYQLFHNGRLPQGAPTSPYISNIFMRGFDTMIQGLLRKYISDDILYTRYADDLTFSSNSRAVRRVIPLVEDKLNKLNLEINNDKTRFLGPAQRQEVTGINLNSGKPTISKSYRRRIRAIVHRASQGCVISDSQKEKALGMISHIALCHPEEAHKYRTTLLLISTVPNCNRLIYKANRIKLKTKKYNKPWIAQSAIRNNTQQTLTRKIK